MSGILLILLAVLLVICLAFCYSEHNPRDSVKDHPFLNRPHKKKN